MKKKMLAGAGIAGAAILAGALAMISGRQDSGEQKPKQYSLPAIAIQVKVSDKVPVYVHAHAPAYDTNVQLSFYLDEKVIENYKDMYKGIRVQIDSMGFNEVYRINEGEKVKKKLIPKKNLQPDGSYELEIVRNPWTEAYVVKQDGSEVKFAENNLDLSEFFAKLQGPGKGSIKIEKK